MKILLGSFVLPNARPRANMTGNEPERLAPWNDVAHARCALAFTE